MRKVEHGMGKYSHSAHSDSRRGGVHQMCAQTCLMFLCSMVAQARNVNKQHMVSRVSYLSIPIKSHTDAQPVLCSSYKYNTQTYVYVQYERHAFPLRQISLPCVPRYHRILGSGVKIL